MKNVSLRFMHKALQAFLFLLFILIKGVVFAQTLITIDHRQMSVDTTGLIGDLELDLDINNTASTQEEDKDFFGFKAITDLSYYSTKHHYFIKSHWAFFELEEEEVLNQSFTYFRTNLFYRKNIAPEFYIQGQFDELRRLNFRGLTGGGLRFVIYEDHDFEIEAGSGIMYEIERWDFEEQNRVVEKRLLKSSSYFGLHKSFGDHGVSVYNLYQWAYDPDIEAMRHRINGDFRFDTYISKLVTLVVHVALSYDARPIIPNKKFVYAISNAVRFSFSSGKKKTKRD